jgi:hypothetical protein
VPPELVLVPTLSPLIVEVQERIADRPQEPTTLPQHEELTVRHIKNNETPAAQPSPRSASKKAIDTPVPSHADVIALNHRPAAFAAPRRLGARVPA